MLRELFSTYFLFPFQNLNAKNFSGTLQKKGMERLNTMAPATPLLEEAEEKSATLQGQSLEELDWAPLKQCPGTQLARPGHLCEPLLWGLEFGHSFKTPGLPERLGS